MKKNIVLIIIALVGVIAVIAVLGGIKGGQIGAMIEAGNSFVPPPESVTTAVVTEDNWGAGISAVASVVPVRSVVLGSELNGLVRDLYFDSGANVQKGAALVRLDTALEEAQLSAAEADVQLARANLDRAQALRKSSTNTQADLDAAEARAKSTVAVAQQIKTTIDKKTIRAPFAGKLGIRMVELGQVLSQGTQLVTLQSVDPVYIELLLPQQNLTQLQLGQKVRVVTDAFPDDNWEGKLVLINNEVDSVTRNVRIRATVPNADGRLRPGMFANATVVLPDENHVFVIPATGVMYAPYGDSVFVVEEKDGTDGAKQKVVRQQFVRLGERRGDMVAVTTGLKAGQTVVSSGAFKLRNGASVNVNNALAPPATLTPKPSDS